MRGKRDKDTVPEQSPKGDKTSDAAAEQSTKEVEAMIRPLRVALKNMYAIKGSCLFGPLDVAWATCWLGWIAAFGWIADSMVVSWRVYRSPPRTESYKDRRNLSKLLDLRLLFQTPSARRE